MGLKLERLIAVTVAVIPVALYGALSTTGCSLDSGGTAPTPTTSGNGKSITPQLCSTDLDETTIGDEKWCCSKAMRWCQAQGAPVYEQSCDEVGAVKSGTTLSYGEAACGDSAPFHVTEERVSTQYECRAEGSQSVWRYAEPSTYCAESVTRQCAPSATTREPVVIEVGRTTAGNGCNY